jgi:hypothetical protein
MTAPKTLLHLEGAAALFAACVGYHELHGNWLLFAVLFLAPDIFMLGYLLNNKIGAAAYNAVHTYTAPLVLLAILWLTGQIQQLPLVLIWIVHIGMDRMLGYGLKYETAFKDTHLNRV